MGTRGLNVSKILQEEIDKFCSSPRHLLQDCACLALKERQIIFGVDGLPSLVQEKSGRRIKYFMCESLKKIERPEYVYGKKDLGLWTGQKSLLREVPNPVKLVAKHRNIVKLCMTDRDVSGQKASLGLQPQDKVSGMTQQAGTAPFLTFQASRTNIKTRPCAYTSQPHRAGHLFHADGGGERESSCTRALQKTMHIRNPVWEMEQSPPLKTNIFITFHIFFV